MARPSLLEEWWPHLLQLEKYCQQKGLNPHEAALRVVAERSRQLPGHGVEQSKVKMLEDRHREHRDELRRELGPVPREYEQPIGIMQSSTLTFAKQVRIKLAAIGANLFK